MRTEKREEQEKKEEQEECGEERDETTKGKEAPAEKRKKLRRGRLIFRRKERKAISRGWLYSLV